MPNGDTGRASRRDPFLTRKLLRSSAFVRSTGRLAKRSSHSVEALRETLKLLANDVHELPPIKLKLPDDGAQGAYLDVLAPLIWKRSNFVGLWVVPFAM